MKDLAISSVAQDQGHFVAGSLLATAPMSRDAIATLARLTAAGEKNGFVQARAWGGAVNAVPEDFNAFPWRKPLFEFQVGPSWLHCFTTLLSGAGCWREGWWCMVRLYGPHSGC